MTPPAAAPYVEHQKAVTIRNEVNLKKESLRIEADEENPGKFLVAFTFDADVAGRYLSSEILGFCGCYLIIFCIYYNNNYYCVIFGLMVT